MVQVACHGPWHRRRQMIERQEFVVHLIVKFPSDDPGDVEKAAADLASSLAVFESVQASMRLLKTLDRLLPRERTLQHGAARVYLRRRPSALAGDLDWRRKANVGGTATGQPMPATVVFHQGTLKFFVGRRPAEMQRASYEKPGSPVLSKIINAAASTGL